MPDFRRRLGVPSFPHAGDWLLCVAKTTTAQIREDQKRCPVEQELWETKR